MVRILLADDHAVVREGVERILKMEGMVVVDQAVDTRSARKLYNELKPDILVMDMSMPGAAGVDGVAHIMQDDPEAKVIIFSIHENPELVERVLELGASGYVTKSCPLAELVVAIKVIYKGGIYVSSELAQALVYKRMGNKKNILATLSEREFNIFCLVAEGKCVDEIADLLFLAEKTVANYISQIKQKLVLKNNVEIVRLAIQNQVIHLDGVMVSENLY